MKQRNLLSRLVAAPLALALLWSCGDSTGPRRTPARVVVISGSAQSAPVNETLPFPVVVEVRDADGRALPDIRVDWAVVSGGGTVASPSTRSGSDGRAEVGWRLGTSAGAQTLTATVTGVAPATFTATATAGTPAGVQLLGDGQTGTAGLPLAQPIAVLVTDAWSNPVPGAAVTFTPAAGSGTAIPATAVTSAAGVAPTIWTLGTTAGPQTLTAVVSALPAVPQQFTAVAAEATIVTLQSDVPLTGLAAPLDALTLYKISVPAGAARLVVTTTGGSGDADVFVRHEALPTPLTYGCSSTAPATTEACTLSAPEAGDWFILLHAYSAYSGVTLRAVVIPGGTLDLAVPGLPAGALADITVTGPEAYRTTVTGARVLGNLLPGDYQLAAVPILHNGALYWPTVASQPVTVTASQVHNAAVTYEVADGTRNLRVGGLHITQATQTTDGALPLIADRRGLLRVFTLSTQLSNSDAPAVRVRLYHDDILVDTRTITAPTSSTPVLIDPSVLLNSWNLVLPAAQIRPGLSVLADVDPGNEIPESDEDDNTYPNDGTPL
ncbi:MAG TPA: pre-peptidase C-terminal domain-containing protein, partial [Longimicrobiales bacterium]|nr:pre-peptidase C-terminal domain-containing protein [Longimicrobiales bacterium]